MSDLVDIQVVTVKLGAREYTILEAPYRRAKPWKQRLLHELSPLFVEMGEMADMTLDSPADLLKLLPLAERLLIESVDTLIDLLCDYAPDIAEDRAYVQDYATDRQIFAAFQEVVKFGDFLGLGLSLQRSIGRRAIATSSSSPSANGASVSEKQRT